MKVLLVRGNPRKHGYTQRVADLFLQGLHEVGAKVTGTDLSALSVQPCLGCFHCWLVTPGQCVHGDDMGAQLEQVLDADVIVCVTPLYFYSMSALLKTWFERTFPLFAPGVVRSARGLTPNSVRFPRRWRHKKLITIVTGALPGPEPYEPLNATFQLIADSLDLELGGQLTRPESYLLDYPLSKPKTLKRIETAFVQAGREAGTTGRLTAETTEAVALPLAASPEHYRTYSNIYWRRAEALRETGLDPAEVQKQVSADVRILMREMVRFFDAKAAARVRAVLQFEFREPDLVYQVRIDRGRCELVEGAATDPDLRVRCTAAVWAGLFTRQTDARQALTQRQIELEGDRSLFARLERFFPPPAT